MSVDALITIILPTFRRPHMLPKAIESVLNQDFSRILLKVYDNCSNDETREVVAHYTKRDNRVRYHSHAQNIGAAANYSYALSEVRTLFFSFLADDDWLLPSFCSTALEAFEAFPRSRFVIGRTVVHSESVVSPSNAARYRPGFYSQPNGMLTLLKNRFPPWIGILFRTEALQAIRPYVTDADGTDFGFMLRASHLEFAAFSHDVAVFQRHSGSSSERLTVKLIWPSHIDAVRAFLESSNAAQVSKEVLAPLALGYVEELIYAAFKDALRSHDYGEAESAASLLRIHFHRKAKSLLLGMVASLMRHSALVERMVDTVFRNRLRSLRIWRRLRRSSPAQRSSC